MLQTLDQEELAISFIEHCFREQRWVLSVQQTSSGWIATVAPDSDLRSIAVAGRGGTRLQAAQDAVDTFSLRAESFLLGD